jgi:hypothetical protein
VIGEDVMLEVGGCSRGRRFNSHQLICAFAFSFSIFHVSCFMFHVSCFMFHVSCFMFHVSCFISHILYVKNTSGMNSVGSLRRMFDRTAGCINRAMDRLSWMSMCDL